MREPITEIPVHNEFDNVDLTGAHYRLVKKLLKAHLPNTRVWAFGSRVTFNTRRTSDLDLVVFTDESQQHRVIQLCHAFEESDLPFTVDVLEWERIPEHFKPNMQRAHFVIQEKSPSGHFTDGWIEVKLEDIANINSSKSTQQDETHNGAYPMFGRLAAITKSDRYLFDCQAVVVSVYRRRCVAQYFSGKFNFINGSCCISAKSENEVQTRFLYYYLYQYLNYWVQLIYGKDFEWLRPHWLKGFPITLPPIEKQRLIVSILSPLEEKIERNQRKVQILEEITKTLFRSWLINFEPVCAKAEGRPAGIPPELSELLPNELVNSEIGKIPKGWQCKSLDDIATFTGGLDIYQHPYSDQRNNLPAITYEQLLRGNTYGDRFYASDAPEEFIVNDGDFLFSWAGTLFAKYWAGGTGVIHKYIFKVEGKGYPLWFVSGWVEKFMPEFRRIANTISSVTGHIDNRDLQRAVCAVPDLPTLEALGEIFQPLVDRQIVLQQESRVLQELRDTVLPKLLSGELDVSDAEQLLDKADIK